MVLGRRPDHRRTADVDLLDTVVDACAAGHRLGERVEIGHDQVDAHDVVLVEGVPVRLLAPVGQDPAVDSRMQRLDPAVEDLGEAGHIRDPRHRDARFGDGRRGGTRGHDLDAGRVQGCGEFCHTGLVVHRDQGALHRSTFRP